MAVSSDTHKDGKKSRLYLGVDVGGTKVQASLAKESGKIMASERCPTPRDCPPEDTLAAIEQAMKDALAKADKKIGDITAIGIAIPGVVDPDKGLVVVTPNMNLTGTLIGPHLEERFGVPVAIGNDCNLGALGETWRGSASQATSSVAILVGTGVGGGYIQDGQLQRGARESAGEIGHIVVQIDGPQCGCGNHGCLEALASRTAIERDIRQAVADGRETALTELTEGNLDVIRSGMLRRALEANDAVVTEVMQRAAEILGLACLTVRHLIDPDVIVIGGGVVEACGDFMMPIIHRVVDGDALAGARAGGRITRSTLGDDAVVMGAIALARTAVDRNPLKTATRRVVYPTIQSVQFGKIAIDDAVYRHDVVIRANGEIKERKKPKASGAGGSSHVIGSKELKKACKGNPDLLFIGTGMNNQVTLNDAGADYLRQRSIEVELVPTTDIAQAYNACDRPKAALIHVTC